jgi:hypothetical protein
MCLKLWTLYIRNKKEGGATHNSLKKTLRAFGALDSPHKKHIGGGSQHIANGKKHYAQLELWTLHTRNKDEGGCNMHQMEKKTLHVLGSICTWSFRFYTQGT